jgi:hypothetical protein
MVSLPEAQIDALNELAETVIFPGEDPAEFNLLHQRLVEEWHPSGPTEDDAVLTLARDLWRKRRFLRLRQAELIQTFRQKERSDTRILDRDPKPFCKDFVEHFKLVSEEDRTAFLARHRRQAENPETTFQRRSYIDEFVQILHLSDELIGDQPPPWVEIQVQRLAPHHREHLERTVPREESKRKSIEWIRAVKHEIDTVLLPAARKELREQFGRIEYPPISEVVPPERVAQDLAMEERLDAAIDRSIKRLRVLKSKDSRESSLPWGTSRSVKPYRSAGWGRMRVVR